MQYFGKFVAFGMQDKKNRRRHVSFCHFACFFIFLLSPFFLQIKSYGKNSETCEEAINRSISSIMSQKTIECNMRVTTLVENVEFIARGRYEEQKLPQSDGQFQQSVFRQDLNFPMEMPSSPGAEANRMMVVCHASQDRQNGRVWIYKSIEGTKTIQYIRLAALEDAVVHSKMNAVYPTVGVTPTLGGIGGTLKGIKNLYDFSTSTVEKGHLAEPDSKSVWKITGTLKSGYFNHYLNTLGGLGKKESYPKELPSDIEICIDRETDFPCRIRYLNRKSAKDLPNLVLIEVAYFDIILNGEEIPEYRFMTFKQDGVFSFQDITVPFITSLRLLIP